MSVLIGNEIYGVLLTGDTIYSGSTPLSLIVNNIVINQTNNKVDISGDTMTGTLFAPAISATTLSGGTIYSGTTNLYDIFTPLGVGGGTVLSVNPGVNTYITGTINANPIVNISGGSFNIIIASGDSRFNILSATTLSAGTLTAITISAGTYYSGTTNLYDIFATIGSVGSGGGGSTIGPGINTTTGGTFSAQTINVTGGSFNQIIASGDSSFNRLSANTFSANTISAQTLTAVTISAGTYYSGTTNLYSIFAGIGSVVDTNTTIGPGINTTTGGTSLFQHVNVTGGSFNQIIASGQSNFHSLSAQTFSASSITAITISAGTYYSGTTNLYSIFAGIGSVVDTNTTIGPGINTTTGGTSLFQYVNVTGGSFNQIIASGDSVFNNFTATTITSPSITIGNAEDGTYVDGLFTDFASGTTVGTAVDRFNEILKALAPPPAPALSNLSGSSNPANSNVQVSGARLTFGSSKSTPGMTNVGNIGGLASVDNNASFTVSTTTGRMSVFTTGTTNPISATTVLNANVAANANTPFYAYPMWAFADGQSGNLVLEHNGTDVLTLCISGATSPASGMTAVSNSNYAISVSQSGYVRFPDGTPLTLFTYRSGGTIQVKSTAFVNGWNYIRVKHNSSTGTLATNYNDWVFDPNSNQIAQTGGTVTLALNTMAGTNYISGVKYFTSGSLIYSNVLSNVYLNIYSSATTAFNVSLTTNLTTYSLRMYGSGITTVGPFTTSPQSLPTVGNTAGNEASFLFVTGTTTLSNTRTIPTTSMQFGITVTHPFNARSSGALNTNTISGFLMWSASDGETAEIEDFSGESFRLVSGDYTASTASYTKINSSAGGSLAGSSGTESGWTATKHLVTADTMYASSLLIYNNRLCYPDSSNAHNNGNFRLTTESSPGTLTTGKAPDANVDYSSISGVREFYRKFKSNNVSSLDRLSFSIAKDSSTTFLAGGTQTTPLPSSNALVLECVVIKSTDIRYGWFNPFATSLNYPADVANLSVSNNAVGQTTTTLTCLLGSTFAVDNTDIIVVRIKAADAWTGYLAANLTITNI